MLFPYTGAFHESSANDSQNICQLEMGLEQKRGPKKRKTPAPGAWSEGQPSVRHAGESRKTGEQQGGISQIVVTAASEIGQSSCRQYEQTVSVRDCDSGGRAI